MVDRALISIKQLVGFAHLVDSGRRRGQRVGYAQSGAADWISFQLSNALVGNSVDGPVIEVMLGSIAFKAEADLVLAVGCVMATSSQQLSIEIDGVQSKINQGISVRRNQNIVIRNDNSVNYFYIALAAKINGHLLFGSVCTVPREKTKTHNNVLAVNQILKGEAIDNVRRGKLRSLFSNKELINETVKKVRALQDYVNMGTEVLFFQFCYQHMDFDFIQKQRFTNSEYRIGKEAGKMGIKLQGPPILTQRRALLSEGICLGAIQISAEGQPMILLNDRQTLGGYPKIGVIGSVDCARIAQKSMGSIIRFESKDVDMLRTRRLLTNSLIQSIRDILSK